MLSLAEAAKYPELVQFLSAQSPLERTQCLEPLLSSYKIYSEVLGFNQQLSPMQIVANLGLFDHLVQLLEPYPTLSQQMSGDILRSACVGGQRKIVQYLFQREAIFAGSDRFTAMLQAVRSGDVLLLQDLLSKPDFEQVLLASTAQFASKAVYSQHAGIINLLLNYPQIFCYIEKKHIDLGAPFILSFIDAKISSMQVASILQLDEVISSKLDEKRLCLCILRHYIRENAPSSQPHINFLLSIPSVKSSAHMDIAEGLSNELFRLAIAAGNIVTEEDLLENNIVKQLARENHFYGNADAAERDRNRQMISTATVYCMILMQARYPIKQPGNVEGPLSHLLSKILIKELQAHILSYLLPSGANSDASAYMLVKKREQNLSSIRTGFFHCKSQALLSIQNETLEAKAAVKASNA